jgi:hypothetical protein
LIEFCLRLNLQPRAVTGALTDRTGVTEWQRISGESFGGTGFASPANASTNRQNRHRERSRKRLNGNTEEHLKLATTIQRGSAEPCPDS